MASLVASDILFTSSSSSLFCSSNRINAAISVPKLPRISFSPLKAPTRGLVEELKIRDGLTSSVTEKVVPRRMIIEENKVDDDSTSMVKAELYAILDAISDRMEMHKNIGEQRDNWNKLLLNSINMITLTAATMAGVAASTDGSAGGSLLGLQSSSALLFSAATGMLVIMNKIQPSQLAEEQRNATRLFKLLQRQIQTALALRVPSEDDVKEAMEKVLALDKAYPLPLLGKMIEKFPKTFAPAVWWPSNHSQRNNKVRESKQENNGWSEALEMEMREIIEVVKSKDTEDYMRLGNLVLKINKILAISGPVLTGIAAVGSFHGSWAGVVAAAAGALAAAVNTFEHGAQVGMLLEMYRNCAGFFTLLEESIESTLNEGEAEKRENGDMFEMKVALELGRSVSELRDLAKTSRVSRIYSSEIGEFASKLF